MPTTPDPTRHGRDSPMSAYLHQRIGATRVMEIEELLEMTLQYLSPEDLRGIKRVNKTWNRIFNGAHLRKALFLDPETSVNGIASAIYPLSKYDDCGGKSGSGTSVCIFNDALFCKKTKLFCRLKTTALQFRASRLLTQDDNAHLPSLVTQPPTTELSLAFVLRGINPDQSSEPNMWEIRTRVLERNGITYRHIVARFCREVQLFRNQSGASEVKVDLHQCCVTIDAFSPEPSALPGWIAEWNDRCKSR